MSLLEIIKKMRGAEAALGMVFADYGDAEINLPKGARLFAYSNTTCFCFFKHYEETVFAVTEEDHKWIIHPIAYNLLDFLRLIVSCGSSDLAARAARLSEESFAAEQDTQWRKYSPALRMLREALVLTPIEDPYRYTHMIGQIIDCSRIGRK